MRNKLLTLTAALLLGTAVQAAPAPLWTAEGFAQPESAAYSAQQNRIYLSNIDGAPDAKDGKGFISVLSGDGKLIKREWKTGLNAPKGLAVKGGLLYVADLDELLEIDTGNLRVLRRFKAAGAKFLNDVALAGDTVYVSDMVTNTIWRLQGESFTPWVHDDALENPNGLLFSGGQLIVASWGAMRPDFSTETPGYLKAVDAASHAVSALYAPIPLGNLDGLVADGKNGLIVSDFVKGNIFRVSPKGEVQLWLPLEAGTADLGIIPGKAVLIPNMNAGTLTAYPLGN